MKSRMLVFTVLLAIALAACATAAPASPSPAAPSATATPAAAAEGATLSVFAAASLTDAFGEIASAFEAANPGVRVTYNFAGSQQLAQQIAEGANVDVFASANRTQMAAVIKAGKVVSGSEQVFARNRLVVIVPADNPAKLQSLADLARPGLRLVLAAKEVPVGQYSLDVLDKAVATADAGFDSTYKDNVLKNVVSYEENVKSVLAKVSLGEADGGIVYTSDVLGDAGTKVKRIDIPDALNTVATYPIAVVSGATQAALAEKYVAYVLSAEGQMALQHYGLIPASAHAPSK